MKDFTKIVQNQNDPPIQNPNQDDSIAESQEILTLNSVERQWKQGETHIEWQVFPPKQKKYGTAVWIRSAILVIIGYVFLNYVSLQLAADGHPIDIKASIFMFGKILWKMLPYIVIVIIVLWVAKYLRIYEEPITIKIDRAAKYVIIRRSSDDIQTVAFRKKGVLSNLLSEEIYLPAFRLPEKNVSQYVDKRDALQKSITEETGIDFQVFDNKNFRVDSNKALETFINKFKKKG